MVQYLSKAVAAIAFLPFAAHAQTFSACNPTKSTGCPANPAIETNFESDFRTGASALSGWTITSGSLTYANDGAALTINKQKDAPTVATNGYLLFGRVEVRTKAAMGTGIISSIVLQSEDLDEVDWEFRGTFDNQVQTNYFGKGNTTSYDRGQTHSVSAPFTKAHTYIVDWTSQRINFYIDDGNTPIRTINYADAVGGRNYPQTPMNVRIGIWAGGDPDNEPGVIQWAGGKTDYTRAPFTQILEYVKITNYSPGKEYVWKDQSGSYQSIQVVPGTANTKDRAAPRRATFASEDTAAVDNSIAARGESDAMRGQQYAGAGEFYPTAVDSTSCTTTTLVVTVTDSSEPTVIYPSMTASAMPSSLMMDTASPDTFQPISSIPIAKPSGRPTPATPSPVSFTGAAAAPTAMGGAVLMAGAIGALLL
ncbi:concanavalin A-like lectin/glucanase [Pseudovirgaria hyperparasitica]|uniref:chitinase n=1 Tax=Pseudovirgaria hyperparasitica TaxID=470096 RepID=A0A6A6VSC1_9PEZI|nr:concanavalin A-like lectin/glucanase [Pseudovirgaria hyperparasitica]KAF2753492.1 concanavalin A-like lectin/glucanase [Pseudovirgaria hyperparasitica]